MLSNPPDVLKTLTRLRSNLWGVGSLTLVLGVWQWASQQYSRVILPPPVEVAVVLRSLLLERRLWDAIAATSLHVLVGFILALGIGGLLGLATGRQSWVRPALTPIAIALLGTPPIAWLVLTMVWFGLGNANSIFTVAITVGPIVFAGVADAVITLDPSLVDVAQVYQLSGTSRFQSLYWPHLISRLLPVLVAGLSLAWRVSIMSEVLATPTGIGAEMNTARANLDTAEVMAWIVITIGLVLASDTLLRRLQRQILPWQQANNLGG
ncbi:binding-protein-dependent transporter system inner membrane protein [Leptolyngbya sp. Heron Island J]|uniref:ABC transporter permease n=1 Tax=Leptolyngbya sp. Heron Island J TaxID=1385935 RepID=UPI0003B9ADEC|nr:ABC transporter permease subunit [Leptolyngbya sp. Heron Island J]ESA34040.1 binding-protein-dependent transporter system inner membrane protein [Leptolyngbya sp. Heron Island J]